MDRPNMQRFMDDMLNALAAAAEADRRKAEAARAQEVARQANVIGTVSHPGYTGARYPVFGE